MPNLIKKSWTVSTVHLYIHMHYIESTKSWVLKTWPITIYLFLKFSDKAKEYLRALKKLNEIKIWICPEFKSIIKNWQHFLNHMQSECKSANDKIWIFNGCFLITRPIVMLSCVHLNNAYFSSCKYLAEITTYSIEYVM